MGLIRQAVESCEIEIEEINFNNRTDLKYDPNDFYEEDNGYILYKIKLIS